MRALQVILALSALILFHELGHFLWARLFRIRVEKFYLFFDLGGFKLFSFRIGETEYGMGWLPLGGYCKIAGMVDESFDTDALNKPPQPWEFRSKPAWQRLLVMAGGVLNNLLVFIGILAAVGRNYMPNESPVYVNELGEQLGFRTGDRILLFDDYAPTDFMDLQSDLARRQVRKATVLRGADTLDIYIDQSLMGEVINSPGVFDVALPFVVDSVMASSATAAAGLLKGDRSAAVLGTDTPYLQDAQKILRAHPGEVVPVTVERDASAFLELPLQVDSLGMLGVFFRNPSLKHRDYTFLEAIPAGCAWAWESVAGYLLDLRLVATPSTGAYKSVGSFVAIGQVFPTSWNWLQFLYILALLSIMLGVMNLLPIPALDGGHMLICLWEMITGRKPSDKFLVVAQMVGMVLLIGLMLLAFGNDIVRLIH